MMTRTLVTSLFLLLSAAANGQSIGVELNMGYSSYAMRDLSTLLQYQKKIMDIPLEITDEFPPYLTFGASLFHSFQKFDVGVDYGFYSTGGRAHYKDYSGEAGIDHLAAAHAVGIFGRYILAETKDFSVKASLLLSMYFSEVEFKQYLLVANLQEREGLLVESKSLVISPALAITYNISYPVFLGGRVGFAMDSGKKMHPVGNKEAYLIDKDENPILIQWSGFRSEVFIGINLDL